MKPADCTGIVAASAREELSTYRIVAASVREELRTYRALGTSVSAAVQGAESQHCPLKTIRYPQPKTQKRTLVLVPE